MARQAVERYQSDMIHGRERGLRFDRAAATRVLDFFTRLRHSKGEWAGQPMILEPWEQFIIWNMFGWLRDDGLRRYRVAYIELPRKNGKTTLVAGIGLYMLTFDGEPGAEVYSAATKREQAKLSWGEAVRMRARSPALANLVHYWRGSDTLIVDGNDSKFQPLGADADTLDGLNVHCAIIDELHAHKTSATVDILETATGARRQPMIIEITTAGFDRESICWQHHEYTRQVLDGTIQDDTWFGTIYSIDEGDAWDDPSVWEKANPNFGVSVRQDDLQRKATKAKFLPAQQNAFMRLHLNVWTQQSDRWIPLELWNANGGEIDWETVGDYLCYGGLDLSSTRDITAWVLAFVPDDPESDDVWLKARFWCPEARLTADDNRYRDQYQRWVREGWMDATPGDAVDYSFIREAILEDAANYDLQSMNIDRLFQGAQTAAELADEGLEVFGMGQGFLSMAMPMKEFERRLLLHKLHHGDNPILAWMADNVAVRQDPAGNLKPDKVASQGKIDGIVSTVMALDRVMRREKRKQSVYETRGLMSV
jgi:phage terminase large subunit-like protein